MSKLEIKVGEIYLTRDGRKAFVFRESLSHVYYILLNGGDISVYHDGQYTHNEEKSKYDLIAKWEDPRLEIAVKALEEIFKCTNYGWEGYEVAEEAQRLSKKALKQIKGSE